MIIDISENKLRDVNELGVSISNNDGTIDRELFRKIMLYYSENQNNNKILHIYCTSISKSQDVFKWMRIVPEVFENIRVIIHTPLTEVINTFIEACERILRFTSLIIKVTVIDYYAFENIINNIRIIKDSIPNVIINVDISCNTKVIDCYSKLNSLCDNVSMRVLFNDNYYYDENTLSELINLYTNENPNTIIVNKLYSALFSTFNLDYNDVTYNDKCIPVIHFDGTLCWLNLFIETMSKTYLNWNHIHDNSWYKDTTIKSSISTSTYLNNTCDKCVLCSQCEFSSLVFINSITIPENVCYNKLLSYKVWSEKYAEILRSILFINKNKMYDILELNKKYIKFLNGGKHE